jgi:hypothetical protein
MPQTTAAQARTFRLAALRALLTPDQLPRFDANVDAMMRRDDAPDAAPDVEPAERKPRAARRPAPTAR